MCGIIGLAGKHMPAKAVFTQALDALAHRGPDAEGFFQEHDICLGHRRLSILDLRPEANQPMFSRCGRYVCVFNGEIYNYQDLGRQFGLHLRTHCDTEVLIELYARLGDDFVQHLNGMFAIAIYDRHQQRLTLWRDRLGIKPLFYYFDGHTLAFASELKGIEQMQLPLALRQEAIAAFLHLGYIPAPLSIYRQVYKLPPGCKLQWHGQQLQIEHYWQARQFAQIQTHWTETEAKHTLKQLLSSSVRYRLISDVPVGVLLSGGVDSGLVAAVAAQESKHRLQTFSIGFEEAQFNEAPFAEQVAQALGSEHHTDYVSARRAIDYIPRIIDIYDEPYADESALPTLLVSLLAKRSVTVALGGDGGDELFWGYGVYQWAERTAKKWFRRARPLLPLLGFIPERRLRKLAAMSRWKSEDLKPWHLFSQEQGFFSLQEIDSLLCASPGNYGLPSMAMPPGLSATCRQALFDLHYYLPDDLLTKVDRASMQVALEVRVPLLDYRIAEFALSLPDHLKYRQGQRKYLLRRLLNDYLPSALFERPKKGFAIPLAAWMQGELKDLFWDGLSENIVRKHGVVQAAYVTKLKRGFEKGNHSLYRRLWALWVLHLFLEQKSGTGI
ncbi:MAG: asparagine synthetase B [Thermonema sp.]|uniref:asparagine synthase (glutamine-hydrolyzing) n=1 Tax=Thermonema sp. TaxID=2231181 RepID=UPI0021DDA49F|nr:asparagine synthase (glutamine-hydrolyzing) [Thermonema sp.]GIV40061.1 MAG: asparagine synthetase B [Thermonema sp.]